MRRIALLSTTETSFIREDERLLSNFARVTTLYGSGPGFLLRGIRIIHKSDAALLWFLSLHTAFLIIVAGALRKPSYLVIGGGDAVAGRDFGLWRKKWKRPFLRAALSRANKILLVDESLRKPLVRNSGLSNLPISVVPTGYDSSFWSPAISREMTQDVITVARFNTNDCAKVKGADLLCEVALTLPDVRFLLVGSRSEVIEEVCGPLPENLKIISEASAEELRELYRTSKLYLLPSRSEGLPNALCEAILCGAVPLATDVGGVRNLLGNQRLMLEQDPEQIARRVREILEGPLPPIDDIRARIAGELTPARRERDLRRLMKADDHA